MPSPKSPSQRATEGRLHRMLAAVVSGNHAGRVVNASPSPVPLVSVPKPDVPTTSGDSTHDGAGADSTALGQGATAPDDNGTALGDNSTASNCGTAVGGLSASGGFGGTSVGYNAQVTDGAEETVTIGRGSRTSANGAVSIGSQSSVDGLASVGIGKLATASGAGSVAIGPSVDAAGDKCVAINTDNLDDNTAKIGGNELEVVSVTTADSSLILSDSTGIRWRITVSPTGSVTAALA